MKAACLPPWWTPRASRQGYLAALTTVPEPGSLAALTLAGLAALTRRRR